MSYDIASIIKTSFKFGELFEHLKLRDAILNLIDLSADNVKIAVDLLEQSRPSGFAYHHIKIRLELLSDIVNGL